MHFWWKYYKNNKFCKTLYRFCLYTEDIRNVPGYVCNPGSLRERDALGNACLFWRSEVCVWSRSGGSPLTSPAEMTWWPGGVRAPAVKAVAASSEEMGCPSGKTLWSWKRTSRTSDVEEEWICGSMPLSHLNQSSDLIWDTTCLIVSILNLSLMTERFSHLRLRIERRPPSFFGTMK